MTRFCQATLGGLKGDKEWKQKEQLGTVTLA